MTISFNGTTNNITGATSINTLTIPTLGFGKVLQVVQGTKSGSNTLTTTSYIDTGLSASITPSSTTSRILVIAVHNRIYKNPGGDPAYNMSLQRNGTEINTSNGGYTQSNAASDESRTMMTLDSPNSTSLLTYKTQIKCVFSTTTGILHENSTILLVEVAA
jgi:hypothetical protein